MPSPFRRLAVYLDLVYILPGTVLVGTGGGFLLDRWLGTRPAFVLIGFLLGVVAGLYYIVRALGRLKARGGNGESP